MSDAHRKILVTGAAGFVGRPLLALLRERRDWSLHAVTHSGEAAIHAGGNGVHWHRANLLEARDVEVLLQRVRPDVLVHLAWVTEHSKFWSHPDNAKWARSGAALVRRFVELGGRRALVTGTCAEYAWDRGDGICRENATELAPATAYGASKLWLSRECARIQKAHATSIAWARLFMMYGPGESPARLTPTVIRAGLRGEVAHCSAGTQVRDFLHVNDVALALLALLDSEHCGPVNVCSGTGITVRRYVEAITTLMETSDRVEFGTEPLPPSEPPVLVGSSLLLHGATGFRPTISLEGGLRNTIDWWRDRESMT